MDELINEVFTIMSSANTGLTKSFMEMILRRLVFLGYKSNLDDAWAISFAIQKVENQIKNSCNILKIPDGLLHIAADRICGEFLFAKKQSGQLDISGLDFKSAISSIKEGDTDVSFDNSISDEVKFNQLLNYLMTVGEGDFVCYRRLKW